MVLVLLLVVVLVVPVLVVVMQEGWLWVLWACSTAAINHHPCRIPLVVRQVVVVDVLGERDYRRSRPLQHRLLLLLWSLSSSLLLLVMILLLLLCAMSTTVVGVVNCSTTSIPEIVVVMVSIT